MIIRGIVMRKNRIYSAVSAFVIAAEMFSGIVPAYAAETLSNEDFYKQICAMIENDDADYDPEEAVTEAQITPDDNNVVINGVEKTLTEVNDSGQSLGENLNDEDLHPKNVCGRVLIPIRVIANALECDIDWNNDTKTVTFAKGDVLFSVDCNRSESEYDGDPDYGILTDKGKAFVPVRAMERLGCSLSWEDGSAKIVLHDDVVLESRRLLIDGNNLDSNSEVRAALRIHGEPESCIVQNDGTYMVVSYSDRVTTGQIREILSEVKKCSGVNYAEPDSLCETSLSAEDDVSGDEITADYSGIREFIRENKDRFSGEVTVAVIDTGIDTDHSLFRNRLSGNSQFLNRAEDRHGHGTHVAGIIASLTSEIGDKVKIKPYKITNSGNFEENNMAFVSGINAAIQAASECDIVNMSISVTKANLTYSPFKNSRSFIAVAAGNGSQEIEKTFRDGSGSGRIINSNKLATSLIDEGGINAIIVSAVNSQDEATEFSNYSKTDKYRNSMIAANGVDVLSARNGGGTTTMSGTSQATPQVSAAAAVLMLANGKNGAEVKNQILNVYKKDFPHDNMRNYGVGILSMADTDVVTTPQPVEQTGYYRWSEDSITMKPGQEKQIKLYYVENGEETEIQGRMELRSSDTAVAEVTNDGKIKAVGAGIAKISYEETGGMSNSPAELTVTVVQDNANNVTSEVDDYEFSKTEIRMKVGERENFKLYAKMKDGSSKDVTSSSTFSVHDNSIADITSDGTIKAVGVGTTYITLVQGGIDSHRENSKKRIKVIVEAAEFNVVDYEWSDTKISLNVGETKNVKLYAKMSDGSRKDVTSSSDFYSDDESIVTISSSGKITAIGAGTTYIGLTQGGVTSHNKRKIDIVVTGTSQPEIVAYEWSESEIDLNAGESINVKLYAKMSDGSRKDVTSSSMFNVEDEGVAKISSSGKISAVGGGTTYITLAQGGIASGVARIKINVAEEEQQSDFEVSSYGGGVEITGYNGSERILSIPDTLDGKKVVRIGNSAFEKNSSISSVSIPSGVTEIGSYAFKSCRNLKSVTLPRSVSVIESYAFDGCSSLTNVSLPRTISEISSYTFRGCSALANIVIPNSVQYIDNSAFANCKTLRIEVPETVEEIHKNAFTRGNYVVFKGKQGSVAEIYAEANGFKFEAK